MGDDVPVSLYPAGGLFLKPEARIQVQVQLPEIRNPGVTVSNWEVMEKLKARIHPEKFDSLRVVNSSRETILFEGEFISVRILKKVILLLNKKNIKLKGFSDPLRVFASQSNTACPVKEDWEKYFREKGVETFNDGRPGERPDTVHIRGLPIKWFVSPTSEGRPCPTILTQSFQRFGEVKQVGFYEPVLSRNQPSSLAVDSTFSSFGPGAGAELLNFEVFIQYKDYKGFCDALASFKGMLLSKMQDDIAAQPAIAKITVDFDRSGFLSERNIRRRLHLEAKKKSEKEERDQKCIEEEEIRQLKEEQEKEKSELLLREKKIEERRKKRNEHLKVAAKLKNVAIQRRTEAQRLMSVLLADAAEARYQEELQIKQLQKAVTQEQIYEEQQPIDENFKTSLLENVHKLEQRRLLLLKELLMRSVQSGKGHGTCLKEEHMDTS